jgi:hypothetical protein
LLTGWWYSRPTNYPGDVGGNRGGRRGAILTQTRTLAVRLFDDVDVLDLYRLSSNRFTVRTQDFFRKAESQDEFASPSTRPDTSKPQVVSYPADPLDPEVDLTCLAE